MRDEFLPTIKKKLSERVALRCSNPNCRVPTAAPSDESFEGVNNIGIAAHICAASSGQGARRYDVTMTSEQRKSIENGIWLCANCSILIDKDEITYSVALLKQWKTQAEATAKAEHGQKLPSQIEIDKIAADYAARHHADAEQIKALTHAITALSQGKGVIGSEAEINSAFDALKRGNTTEAKKLFTQAAEKSESVIKSESQKAAEAYRNLGAIAFLDNTQEALNAYRRATELDSDIDDWSALGALLYRVGELDKAAISFQKLLELAETRQDQKRIARAYNNLGLVFDIRGELDKAVAMYNRALKNNEALGNKQGMAENYRNLGCMYATYNNLDKAFEMHNNALKINKALNDKEGIGVDYTNLGAVYQTRGDLNNAIKMQFKALRINKALEKKEMIAHNYGNLGIVFYALGNFDKAVEFQNRSLEINEAFNIKMGIAINYYSLGIAYYKQGELTKAVQFYKKSLEINEFMKNKQAMARDYVSLGLVYIDCPCCKTETKRYWQLAVNLYKQLDSSEAQKWQRALDAL